MIRSTVGQGVVRLVPNAFVGIQFGRVGGKAFQMQSAKASAQVSDRVAFVGFAVVPNDEDVPLQVPEQITQEPTNLGLLDVFAVQLKVKAEASAGGADGERGEGGDAVVFVAMASDGGLAAGSPGPADRRDQEKAGFVDKGNMGAQPRGVFFIRGHSRRFQSSMASSLRWRARRSGF